MVFAVLLPMTLIAIVATPSAASQRLHGVIVDVRSPTTVVVAQAASAGMPAMSMPFVVALQTMSRLRRGMRITAVVDARTSPARLSAVHIVMAAAPLARYVPDLNEGDTIPDFALVDQRGRELSISRFRGQALVLSFIYTRFRDATMCSLVSAKFSRLQHALGHDPIHLMEVTLDPGYDTPRTLDRYGRAFGAIAGRWTLATGDATAISELAARAGIVTSFTPRGIAHTEAVLILDPSGRLWRVFDGNSWSADGILNEARASLGDVPKPAARMWLWLESGVSAVCGGKSGLTTRTALSIFIVLLIVATLVLRRFLRTSDYRVTESRALEQSLAAPASVVAAVLKAQPVTMRHESEERG